MKKLTHFGNPIKRRKTTFVKNDDLSGLDSTGIHKRFKGVVMLKILNFILSIVMVVGTLPQTLWARQSSTPLKPSYADQMLQNEIKKNKNASYRQQLNNMKPLSIKQTEKNISLKVDQLFDVEFSKLSPAEQKRSLQNLWALIGS